METPHICQGLKRATNGKIYISLLKEKSYIQKMEYLFSAIKKSAIVLAGLTQCIEGLPADGRVSGLIQTWGHMLLLQA